MKPESRNPSDDLLDRVLAMSQAAEMAVQQAIKALVERDDDLAVLVLNHDVMVDRLEIEIDEIALHLIEQTAPRGKELRLITVVVKIAQNLERIGDESVAIARRVLDLNREPPLKPYADLPRMAVLAVTMLKGAMEILINGNTSQARSIIEQDNEVDEANRQVHSELVSLMVTTPNAIPRSLSLLFIAKRLERIADHATNIAEEAVFLYEARDIRHLARPAK